MSFKDLVSKAEEITGATAESAGKLVDEFNAALPAMRALGFTVKDLRVGMGLVPEIHATLVASAETIDAKKINEIMAKHAENKTLAAALKALLAAYNIKQQISDFPYKGVEIDIKLGLPPHVGVGFLSSTPTAVAVPATAHV